MSERIPHQGRDESDVKDPVTSVDPLSWFDEMIPHCKAFAQSAQASGRPIVGIMCEYAPRELILAAGAVPVCLCGGDADTIASAEGHLPANLCPLIKSTYGYLVERSNPFLEMADLVVAETTCDGKKKMFELMSEQRPTYLLELPQKEDDPEALASWVREMHRFREFLEQRYHTLITPDKIRAAIVTMNRERRLRRELAELMQVEQPPLTGRQLLELKSIISGIPADLDQYEKVLTRLRRPPSNSAQPPEKVPPPVSEPPTVAREDRAVRVLLTGVPIVHGAERVMDLIESHGGLVVCQENCTGLKPILEDVPVDSPDLLQALAVKYYHLPCSVKTPNQARRQSLRDLAAAYRAECVIDLIWQACLTYSVESRQIRRLAEEELGLPFLQIETDYSPSDSARLAVRIEALMEMVRSRRSETHDRSLT